MLGNKSMPPNRYEINRKKIIGLLCEIDVENTTTVALFRHLRDHGFKPPHGKNWSVEKLMEIIN
jgi:hypothetical protein